MEDDKDKGVDVAQPGQTISPGSSTPPAPQPPTPPAPVNSPSAPQPPQEPDVTPPTEPAPPPEEAQLAPEQFAESPGFGTEEDDVPADSIGAEQPITWTASEFIAHAKSAGWYFLLALAAIVIAVVIYVITRDVISSGVIIVAATFLGFYAGHKPREMQYQLDDSGLSIGNKHFSYSQFRSFSVLPEGAFSSIVFMPLKRFAVQTTIYYPPEYEEKIVNMLGSILPMEQQSHDAVDRLMHKIHF